MPQPSPDSPEPGTPSRSLDVTDFILDFRIVVVAVSGVLDLDSCPVLQARLAHALTLHHPPRLVIDLSHLTSADSFGLTVLLAADRHVRADGGGLVICAPAGLVRQTLRDRRLDLSLNVQPTLIEAIRELDAGHHHS